MKRLLILIALVGLAVGCACDESAEPCAAECGAKSASELGLAELTQLMTGAFSSAAQAAEDEEFYEIHLKMARIWKDREDGVWLYVEQAAKDSLDKPYRQRVYRVRALDADYYESLIYALDDPEAFIGAWGEPARFDTLTDANLAERNGCGVILRRVASGNFVGGTLARQCESKLRGASFATTEIEMDAKRLISWDRGFDDAGKQVWGAEKSGYVFDKHEDWSAE